MQGSGPRPARPESTWPPRGRRGRSESGQERGGAAVGEASAQAWAAQVPDEGAVGRRGGGGPDGRARRVRAPTLEPWSSGGREAVKPRPREMRRRLQRSLEPRLSAIAASGAASSFTASRPLLLPALLPVPTPAPSGVSPRPRLVWGEGRRPDPFRACVQKQQAQTGSGHGKAGKRRLLAPDGLRGLRP